MERDILQAQKAMNLSQRETYSEEQQQALAFKIAHEAKAHKMPPLQYRMIHWNARVEDAEIRALANWAHVSSSESNQQAGDGDPVRGKGLVEKRCSGCHSLTQNHQGPRLQGVYGRVSGSVADYTYSQTMKNSRIAWNEKSLDKWLADPDAFLPGNNMDFLVPKPQDRLDIISYLKQSSGKLAYIATRSRHWPWMASELPATSTLSCQLLLTALCAQGASLGGGWPSPSAPTILRKARIYHGAIGVSRYLSLENFGFPVIPLNLEVWYTLHQQLRLLRDSSNVLRPDRPCSVCGHRCNR
jgi:cytochrome c2